MTASQFSAPLIVSVEELPSATDGQEHKIGSKDAAQSVETGFKGDCPSKLSPTVSLNGHTGQRRRVPQRRKPHSFLRRCKRFAVDHTWTVPLVLILAFLALYAINPTESNIIHRFIFLSYKQTSPEATVSSSTPTQYGKGLWDVAFISFYTIVLSFTREFIMQELLRPLAYYCGIRTRGKQFRFMEQMYTAIYFACIGVAGIYVMRQTPVWYFNTRGMYELYPHKTHEASFKFYYLFQAAYWAQQAIVMLLGMEKPRKDFKELVAHHIITLSLIALSYRFHFTYIGIGVYIIHDISDFFLALSKSLHYIDCPLVELYFGSSIVSWIYFRHYQNLRIIISLFTEFRTVGPYDFNWEMGQYKGVLSNVITAGLLISLQAINIFWLYCLLRSAYRFLVHNIAKDDRSEVEDSEIEEMERKKAEKQRLISGNKHDNGSANGVGKATGNGSAVQPMKKTSAVRRIAAVSA